MMIIMVHACTVLTYTDDSTWGCTHNVLLDFKWGRTFTEKSFLMIVIHMLYPKVPVVNCWLFIRLGYQLFFENRSPSSYLKGRSKH